MLRRLTVPELETTIRAAFNLTPAQWAGPDVPPDPASIDGFSNNVDRLTVGPEYARGMLETGRKVAADRGHRAAGQPACIPCHKVGEAGPGQAPCAQTFVTTFGPKLYRRPLTPAEVARYVELHRNTGRRRLPRLRALGDLHHVAVAARDLPERAGRARSPPAVAASS